jgi:hypothetical protein
MRYMKDIRLFEERDWAGTRAIIEPVFRAGENHSCPVDPSGTLR